MAATKIKAALSKKLLEVSAESRLAEYWESDPIQAVFAVFSKPPNSDEPSRFVGLADPQKILQFPDRIFLDLLFTPPPPFISMHDSLKNWWKEIQKNPHPSINPVTDEQGMFVGAVTAESAMEALLKMEELFIEDQQRAIDRLDKALLKQARELKKETGLKLKAAHDLERSQQRFQAYFEQSTDALVIIDPETTLPVDFNDKAPELLECTPAEFARFRIADYENLESPEEIHAHIQNVLQKGQDSFETQFCTKAGNIKDVWVSIKVIEVEGKHLLHNIFRDISHPKALLKKLEASESRYRTLVTATNAVVASTDPEGFFIHPQPSWEHYTGQTWPDYQGWGWEKTLHPDDRKRIKFEWAALLKDPKIFQTTGRIWHAPTKEYRQFLGRAVPFKNPDGTVQEWIATVTDIHEQKQAELTIQESERIRAGILDAAQEAIISINESQRITYINPGAEKLFGYQLQEVEGQPLTVLIPDQFIVPHAQYVQEFIDGEEPSRGMGTQREVMAKRKDGTIFMAEASLCKFLFKGQWSCTALLRDVTEQRKHQNEILSLKERLEFLIANSPACIYTAVQEKGAGISFSSRKITDLLGYAPDDFLSQPNFWLDHIHPNDKETYLAMFPKFLSQGTVSCDYRVLNKDGEYRWIRDIVNLVSDPKGNLLECIGYWMDITPEKEAAQELHLATRIFESVDDLISVIGSDYRYQKVNPYYETILGIPAKQIRGMHVAELSGQDAFTTILKPRFDECLQGTTVKFETWLSFKKIGRRYLGVTYCPLILHGGNIGGIAVITRDLTHLKLMEERLKESQKRLRVLSRTLSEIQERERHHLAMELHDEIGQTLTAIKLTLSVAKEHDDMGRVKNSVQSGIKMITGLLSQVRNLALDLHPCMLDDLGLPFALKWHVDRVAKNYKAKFLYSVQELKKQPDAPIALAIFKIAQEALTNVSRHSKATCVTIRLEEDKKLKTLMLSIEDNGRGFSSDKAIRKKRGIPLGLGLMGMEERAIWVGGIVTVQSKPGEGTKILGRFPYHLKGPRLVKKTKA